VKQEKSLFVKLAQCAVSAGLLYWIVSHYSISFSTLFPSLASPLSLVATLIISLGFIQILAAVRWRTLLASMAMKLPLAPLLGINVTAIFWGSLLPSSDGFAALRILIFSRRYPAHSATGAASVICEKIYGFFALFIWAIVGMAVLSRWHWPLIFASLIFIAFIYLLLLVLPLPGKISKNPLWASIHSWLSTLRQQFSLLPHARLLPLLLPLILTIQLLSFLIVFLLFQSIGVSVPFINCLLTVPLIQFIALVPISLGGFGVREAAFVALFAPSGVDASSAITVSVLSFLVLTAAPAVVGGMLQLTHNIAFVRKPL